METKKSPMMQTHIEEDDESSQYESDPDPRDDYPDELIDPLEAKGPCVLDGEL
jgi:hypothetical protein